MLIRLLGFALGIWPERWAVAFGERLGALAFALGIRRAVAMENLGRAFPDLAEAERLRLARAHYAHLGRALVEFLRAPELLDRVDAGDWEVLANAHAQGKGLIACVTHLGSFELFAGYGVRRGLPLTVVTRELKGAFNRGWLRRRGALGVRELRGREVVASMVHVLREKGVLALVIDQNMLPRRAVFAPFFGELAATTPAPAVLAQRTGAPVVLGALLRNPDGGFRVRFEGPFELRGIGSDAVMALTNDLNLALEKLIREAPEQWFWVHRRWKTRPTPELASTT